jgi:hypothetical protein
MGNLNNQLNPAPQDTKQQDLLQNHGMKRPGVLWPRLQDPHVKEISFEVSSFEWLQHIF